MTDRPTGPATLSAEDRIRREFLDELVASGVVSTPVMSFAEIKETLARFERRYRFVIEQETKARILAVLPEALRQTGSIQGHFEQGPLDEDGIPTLSSVTDWDATAAALAAAIEKTLEKK